MKAPRPGGSNKIPHRAPESCIEKTTALAASAQKNTKVEAARVTTPAAVSVPKEVHLSQVLAAPQIQVPMEVQPSPAVAASPIQSSSTPFSPSVFHRELNAILKDLSATRNVAVAVGRVRAQNVPKTHQAKEFADIITRATEESRGPVRRTAFAFCAGLAAAEQSAFFRAECLSGINIFFKEIYDDLSSEVSRLPCIMSCELLPTLLSVLPPAEVTALLPKELKYAKATSSSPA